MLPMLLNAAGLAMTLGPIIAGFFKGDDKDGAASKVKTARDGMISRMIGAGMNPKDAQAIVDDQLAPIAQDHGGEGGWGALSSALGGALLAHGLMSGGGKAAGAAKVAEEAAEKAGLVSKGADDVAEAAGGPSPTQASALASLAEHGRLDNAVMASKRQGLPVISGKQEQALGGIVGENRMTRQFDPNDEVPSATQSGAVEDLGLGQHMTNEVGDPAVGDAAVQQFLDHFRRQEAMRLLMKQNGFPGGFRTPGGLPG